MASGQLQRRLGLTSAISITVGAVIGSGIFLKPLSVAQALPSEAWIYVMWVGLGIVCLFGAFAYAELGAMLPEAGGQYTFLREGWGRFTGFLYGWTFFWVINSGTVAALALGFAENLLPLFGVDVVAHPEQGFWMPVVAIAMILVLALVNHFGVVLGAMVQNVSTFAKLGALGLIVIGGFVFAGGDAAVAAPPAAIAQTTLTMAGVVTAFTGIFWAYEGWYQMPFNAAELKRPERNLPLGLIGGMVILIAVYLFINIVYLRVVPFAEMQAMPKGTAATHVAALTVERVFSPRLANYLTLLIAVSIFGAANPNMLSSPRAFYAMGQDGLVPAALHRVSDRWATPVVSIWVQAGVGVLLVLMLGTFGDTTDFVVFAGFLFYALTVASVYRLRRRLPHAERPYRCTGYPVTPALFIVVAVAFVAAMLRDEEKQRNALKGLAIISAGVPYTSGGRAAAVPETQPDCHRRGRAARVGAVDVLQFSLFFVALLIGYVLVHLRLIRFEEHLQKLAGIRGLDDRLRALDDRLRLLGESFDKIHVDRIEGHLGRLHEDLEDLREATTDVRRAVVQIPTPVAVTNAEAPVVVPSNETPGNA